MSGIIDQQTFGLSFDSLDGPYEISYRASDPSDDGVIVVTIRGTLMRWDVDHIEGENEALVLGGMTSGSHVIWGKTFWFELRLADGPAVIRYWGDRVVWREDRERRPGGR